jgi:hypothetical protein
MENDGRGDFDFWFGDWTIHNRRLRRRLQNDTEWQEFDAKGKAWPLLGGLGNVDSFDAAAFPTDGKPLHGASFRTFNPGTRLWSIYWADDRSFDLQPPVHGRFENGRGEFFGDDTFDGRPIRVRYIWSHITPTSARWDQAFSSDGGKTWETNWYMTMARNA